MKVVFRANGGGGIGLGHLTRCLALADAFKVKKIESRFICRATPEAVVVLENCHYKAEIIPAECSLDEDLEFTLSFAKDADIIIADSYLFTSEYLCGLHKSGKFVVAVDDLVDRQLLVDVVIGNAYSTRDAYHNLLPKPTELIAGPSHLLLGKLFQQLPSHFIHDRIQTVLISTGGECHFGSIKNLINALSEYQKPLTVHIIIGMTAQLPNFDEIKKNHLHEYVTHQYVHDMAVLYREIDVAITAAGMTSWELAASGVPMILIKLADNQMGVINYMKEHSLGYVLENVNLAEVLISFEDPDVRRAMSDYSQKIVDGRGPERVADQIIEKHTNDIKIKFNPVDGDPDGVESRLIWQWRNDPITRKMSRTSGLITLENHREWFIKTVSDLQRKIMIASIGNDPVCMVRFDLSGNGAGEISLNMNPNARGKEYAEKILLEACRYGISNLDLNLIHASIKVENEPSIRTFEAVGFVLQGTSDSFLRYALQL